MNIKLYLFNPSNNPTTVKNDRDREKKLKNGPLTWPDEMLGMRSKKQLVVINPFPY